MPNIDIYPTFGENEMSPKWIFSFIDPYRLTNISFLLFKKYWGAEYGGPYWVHKQTNWAQI